MRSYCPNRKPKWKGDVCDLAGVPETKIPKSEKIEFVPRTGGLTRLSYEHYQGICVVNFGLTYVLDKDCQAFKDAKKMCDGTYGGVICDLIE